MKLQKENPAGCAGEGNNNSNNTYCITILITCAFGRTNLYFLNIVKLNQIWFSNQSENGKYDLILVDFTRFRFVHVKYT